MKLSWLHLKLQIETRVWKTSIGSLIMLALMGRPAHIQRLLCEKRRRVSPESCFSCVIGHQGIEDVSHKDQQLLQHHTVCSLWLLVAKQPVGVTLKVHNETPDCFMWHPHVRSVCDSQNAAEMQQMVWVLWKWLEITQKIKLFYVGYWYVIFFVPEKPH